jgi:hypothetical protein
MLGNNTTPGNATNFLEYDNSTYGIKKQYPDWSVEGASNSVFFRLDSRHSVVTMSSFKHAYNAVFLHVTNFQ